MKPIGKRSEKLRDEVWAGIGAFGLVDGAFIMYTGEWGIGALFILISLAFFCDGMYGILARRRRHREQKRAAAKDRNGG